MIPLALSTMPFVFGVLGRVSLCSIWLVLQTSSKWEGFWQSFPFLDLISRFVNSGPLSVKTCVISKGKKFQTPIHKILRIFTHLGFIDSIKQTSCSSVDSNKKIRFFTLKGQQIGHIHMKIALLISFKLFGFFLFLLRNLIDMTSVSLFFHLLMVAGEVWKVCANSKLIKFSFGCSFSHWKRSISKRNNEKKHQQPGETL